MVGEFLGGCDASSLKSVGLYKNHSWCQHIFCKGRFDGIFGSTEAITDGGVVRVRRGQSHPILVLQVSRGGGEVGRCPTLRGIGTWTS